MPAKSPTIILRITIKLLPILSYWLITQNFSSKVKYLFLS